MPVADRRMSAAVKSAWLSRPYVITRARVAARMTSLFGSSALSTASPSGGRRSNSLRLAARYASKLPWKLMCSGLRFVKIATLKWVARMRSSSSAWELVSTMATSSPAWRISASVRCTIGASGVVWSAAFGRTSSPILVLTVVNQPVFKPCASRMAARRWVVEVLPSVPVTPITVSLRLG